MSVGAFIGGAFVGGVAVSAFCRRFGLPDIDIRVPTVGQMLGLGDKTITMKEFSRTPQTGLRRGPESDPELAELQRLADQLGPLDPKKRVVRIPKRIAPRRGRSGSSPPTRGRSTKRTGRALVFADLTKIKQAKGTRWIDPMTGRTVARLDADGKGVTVFDKDGRAVLNLSLSAFKAGAPLEAPGQGSR